MSEFFLKIVNMSISAGWLVLAVFAARLLLRQAPKWVNVALWGIVAVRLICPFTIESALSLIPSAETISPEIMLDPTPAVDTGISSLNSVVNPIIAGSFTPEPLCSANPLQIWIPVAGQFWLLGMMVMAIYTAVSYFRLYRRVRTAVHVTDNIWLGGSVPTPFVLGIVKPRIYLPEGMDEQDLAHVIAHEQTHIRRRDHWWKPLGFVLLTIHWFNPLMWIAYILLCRDIELACDERVIQELDRDARADYSQALLGCSVGRKLVTACPLAFGEVGVGQRVKNVLRYKKPGFWIVVIAVALCVLLAVCFLTNPNSARAFDMTGQNVADLEPEAIAEQVREIIRRPDAGLCAVTGYSLMLTEDFDWAEDGAIQFWYRGRLHGAVSSAQLRIFREDGEFFVTQPNKREDSDIICFLETYLEALKYMPQAQIRMLAPDADGYMINLIDRKLDGRGPEQCDRAITYTKNGPGPMDSHHVHLELLPLHARDDGYHGMGNETIHLFYGENLTQYATPDPAPYVVSIVDRAVTERLPTDEALELFWEDDAGEYYFASIRSHLVMVNYSDGASEDIRTALAAGRVSIGDLNIFGIHYYFQSKEAGSDAVIPSRFGRGIFGSCLYVPVGDEVLTYAYETAANPGWGQEPLITFYHQGQTWMVTTLADHPDRSKVLLASESGFACVCGVTEQVPAADHALMEALRSGAVVAEDGALTHGAENWNAFRQGESAQVTLVHYDALSPDSVLNGGYGMYPMLREYTLRYDGEKYTLACDDGVREYAHLVYDSNHDSRSWFLAQDADMTLDKLFAALHDGANGPTADYFIICTRSE